MKKIVRFRKAVQGFLVTLALATTISGCSFKDQKNLVPDDSIAYEHVDENALIDEGPVIDEHEHNHEDEKVDEADIKLKEDSKTIDDSTDKDYVVKEAARKAIPSADQTVTVKAKYYVVMFEGKELIIPDLSEQYNSGQYVKESINYALELAGFDKSYEYRATLARFFNIQNYRGSKTQNPLLLSYLRNLKIYLNMDLVVGAFDENGVQIENDTVIENNDTVVDTNQGQDNSNGNGSNGGDGSGNGSDDTTKEEDDKKDDEHTHQYGPVRVECVEKNDKTHILVKYRDCYKGDSTITVGKIVEAHKFEWKVDPTDPNYEIGTCSTSECGYTIRRLITEEHKHVWGPEQTKYVDITDKTHTKVVFKVCAEDGEILEVSRVKTDHGYTWVANPTDPTKENGECECGHTTEREVECQHDLGPELTRTEAIPGDTKCHKVTTYQVCRKCGSEMIKEVKEVPHNVEWVVDPEDPNYEILICKDCNEVLDRREIVQECKHTDTFWRYKSDSAEEQVCKDCNEVLGTRGHSGLREEIKFESVDANGHKVITTVYCDADGCDGKELVSKRKEETTNHDMVTEITGSGYNSTTHWDEEDSHCSKCDYVAETKKVNEQNHTIQTDIEYKGIGDVDGSGNYQHEKKTTVVCTDGCGYQDSNTETLGCNPLGNTCGDCHQNTKSHQHTEVEGTLQSNIQEADVCQRIPVICSDPSCPHHTEDNPIYYKEIPHKPVLVDEDHPKFDEEGNLVVEEVCGVCGMHIRWVPYEGISLDTGSSEEENDFEFDIASSDDAAKKTDLEKETEGTEGVESSEGTDDKQNADNENEENQDINNGNDQNVQITEEDKQNAEENTSEETKQLVEEYEQAVSDYLNVTEQGQSTQQEQSAEQADLENEAQKQLTLAQ